MRYLLIALVALTSLRCGGEDEVTPTAPLLPPISAPVPEPPPKPEPDSSPIVLSKPTGIHVSDRGQDFIEWSWDPVENATVYEADVAPGEPHVYPKKPTYRYEGLEPNSAHKIWVRAIRETESGQITSEWSDGVEASTLSLPSPPHVCSNEQELVREYGGNGDYTNYAFKIWDGEPLTVGFDAEELRECGISLRNDTGWYRREIIERLKTEEERINNRIGYGIFEASPEISLPEADIKVVIKGDEEENACRGTACANPGAGIITFNRSYCDPAIRFEHGDREDSTVIHELAHILGFKHHRDRGDLDSKNPYGLEMSLNLQNGGGRHFTDYDIDRLACAYKQPSGPLHR